MTNGGDHSGGVKEQKTDRKEEKKAAPSQPKAQNAATTGSEAGLNR